MDMVPLGVRKGAWTEEEDCLLKKYVEKHGEGKWHQVPHKAGLNRCRKSCRLRWLNYLSPNIKRGNFTVDEVDLIIRLHKLLGNRWSLIAGRLPGRTSNDVKNYWNTHLHKKPNDQRELDVQKSSKTTKSTIWEKTKVIRPRPRTFSKNNLPWLMDKTVITDKTPTKENFSKKPFRTLSPGDDDGILWWDNMLFDSDISRGMITWTDEEMIMEGGGEKVKSSSQGAGRDPFSCVEDQAGWSDLLIDNMDLWNILDDDQVVP